MKRRTIAFVALAVAALTAVPALAQGQGRPRGRGFGQGVSLLRLTAPLEQRLKITADQKAKLQALQEAVQQESRRLFQSAGGDRQAAAQKVRELSQKSEAEAEGLLDASQKTEWAAVKADLEKYQGLGRSGPALISVTGLNEDQKAKLAKLSMDMGAKRRELFQPGGDRAAAQEKMRALEMETVNAVKGILNADQQKAFDAALQAAGPRRRPGGNQ
jgi:hypothetical protein